MSLSLVALEEHWLTGDEYSQEILSLFPPVIQDNLRELGPRRIQSMDSNDIAMQVVSHIPYNPQAELARTSNDTLASAIKDQRSRFAAFALLSMDEPKVAATELERTVKDLGFVGALIANHTDDGVFFDTEDYLPFWEKAVELDVPIYLHPANPSTTMLELCKGPYSARTQRSMASWCWGWHSMCAVHLMRLYASGLFERLPKLKIIIGHMGEMVPFVLDRFIGFSNRWDEVQNFQRKFRQVWDENIWITTAGVFSMSSMSCLLAETKIDRIMYGVDYPMCANEHGKAFMEALKSSGLVDEDGLRKIAHKNAEQLLNISPH